MKKISIFAGHPNLENSTANKTILSILEKENNVSITKVIEEYSNYEIDSEGEINKLLQTDVVVLQFPFHWYGVPAILKKWIDSITTPLVYGPNKGDLKGKTFIISTTTGGPQESYQANGYNKYTMKELLLPLFKLGDSLGMHVLEPLVLHGANGNPEEIKPKAEEHALKLMSLINKDSMKKFWNDRYSKIPFAYGKEPNKFFKQELDKLNKGKILLPADGEGRNSVYAVINGWNTYACDLSVKGKEKAEKLAFENKVEINYEVGDFGSLEYEEHFFDAVALVYAHFPADKKADYHAKVDKYLNIGGTIIFEAFGKNHLEYNSKNSQVGGPKDVNMLYSVEEIKSYFPNYEIVILEEVEVNLNEGQFHIGIGSAIRFVGRKVS